MSSTSGGSSGSSSDEEIFDGLSILSAVETVPLRIGSCKKNKKNKKASPKAGARMLHLKHGPEMRQVGERQRQRRHIAPSRPILPAD